MTTKQKTGGFLGLTVKESEGSIFIVYGDDTLEIKVSRRNGRYQRLLFRGSRNFRILRDSVNALEEINKQGGKDELQ